MGKFIVVFVLVVALIGGTVFGLKSCSTGGGSGEGIGIGAGTPATESIASGSDSPENTQAAEAKAEIKIEDDKIYFDGELCADENDLKDKITAMGTQKEYYFIHDKAIKATYDQVNDVLLDLKDALDITVHEQ